MKKLLPILFALILIVSISGCTQNEIDGNTPTVPFNDDPTDSIEQEPIEQDLYPNCPDSILNFLNDPATSITDKEFKEEVDRYGSYDGFWSDFLDDLWKEEAGNPSMNCWIGGKNKGENINYVYCHSTSNCEKIIKDDIFQGYYKIRFLISYEVLSTEETGSEEYGEKYKTTLDMLTCDYEYLSFDDLTKCYTDPGFTI